MYIAVKVLWLAGKFLLGNRLEIWNSCYFLKNSLIKFPYYPVNLIMLLARDVFLHKPTKALSVRFYKERIPDLQIPAIDSVLMEIDPPFLLVWYLLREGH